MTTPAPHHQPPEALERALLPCPFCGSASVVWSETFKRVRCNGCFIGSPGPNPVPSSREAAIAAWNRRTPPAPAPGSDEDAVAARIREHGPCINHPLCPICDALRATAPPTSAASARAAAVVDLLLGTTGTSLRCFDDDERSTGVWRRDAMEPNIARILAPFFPAAPGWTTVTDDPGTWPPVATRLTTLYEDFDGEMNLGILRSPIGCGHLDCAVLREEAESGARGWKWMPWPSTPEARP